MKCSDRAILEQSLSSVEEHIVLSRLMEEFSYVFFTDGSSVREDNTGKILEHLRSEILPVW